MPRARVKPAARNRARRGAVGRLHSKGRKLMSRIPKSAIPHAWAEDSEHAEEVRRARGEVHDRPSWLQLAAIAGVAAFGLTLLFGRRRHA